METSAGHCFDESRPCVASLPEYQHQSSATHSSREPADPPAAHLRGAREDKRPGMGPELPSLRSHLTTLEVWGFVLFFLAQGRRRDSSPDRFRHTGFLFQPQQRHMERPYFYQGRDYRRMKRRFSGMSRKLRRKIRVRRYEVTTALLPGESERSTLIFVRNAVYTWHKYTLRAGFTANV